MSNGPYFHEKPADLECGGTITSSQTIASPLSPSNFYYNNLYCEWNVQLDPSVTSFELRAKKFSVEERYGWCNDVFEVFVDGLTNKFCGYVDPATLQDRRRREAELSSKSRVRRNSVNTSGLVTHTVMGNKATLRFKTNASKVYRGFEIEIDDGTTTTPTETTPTQAWDAIDNAASDLSLVIKDFYTNLPGLGANSKLAEKKFRRFNAIFAQMVFLKKKSSTDPCAIPLGSNDHAAFVPPVDSADACEEFQGLFASLASFADSYVCVDKEGSRRPFNTIQRQRKLMLNRRFKQMKCGN